MKTLSTITKFFILCILVWSIPVAVNAVTSMADAWRVHVRTVNLDSLLSGSGNDVQEIFESIDNWDLGEMVQDYIGSSLEPTETVTPYYDDPGNDFSWTTTLVQHETFIDMAESAEMAIWSGSWISGFPPDSTPDGQPDVPRVLVWATRTPAPVGGISGSIDITGLDQDGAVITEHWLVVVPQFTTPTDVTDHAFSAVTAVDVAGGTAGIPIVLMVGTTDSVGLVNYPFVGDYAVFKVNRDGIDVEFETPDPTYGILDLSIGGTHPIVDSANFQIWINSSNMEPIPTPE